jgi:DNA repair exonuclease SbcCD ATPase subunit
LQSLEWDNLFNYGEGNAIDFTKLEGIVGIFGKNYSGKSSIVDTLLYSLYNSTSKSIRKNLNIINQNMPSCRARATIKVDGSDYVIERSSEKYIKKLKGVETQEATTDVDFHKEDMIGNVTELNGTSRQNTDKNVKKYFGTLGDFLATSMASQLDSLSFINEGSTKRKEFLAKFLDLEIFDKKFAKFLDLEIFDKKFKLAKEDSSSLRRLEGTDFETEIKKIKRDITKSELGIESNTAQCATLKQEKQSLTESLRDITSMIESVPAEIIDPVVTAQKITEKRESILDLTSRKTEAIQELAASEEKFEKIADFLSQFDIKSYQEKKEAINQKKEQLTSLLSEVESVKADNKRHTKKQELLSEVPCGNEYASCKFIKDAHKAGDLIQITERKIEECTNQASSIEQEISDLEPDKVDR